MFDFTLSQYRTLLEALLRQGYTVLTFEDYCTLSELPARYVILRHDVDKCPMRSVATAEVEHQLGIRASYYFRCVPASNNPDAIRRIAALGHEVGYHYEDMSIANGDIKKAYAHFADRLAYFRTFYPVRTICMHGAPMSRWDGRELWQKYNYKDCGIVGEPYFDVDFSSVFYLTDTGRCWDGYKVSVRDKIPVYQDQWIAHGLVYRHTTDIIHALSAGTLPERLMMTTHPQRWTDSLVGWTKELISQNTKNFVKRILIYAKKNTR